MMGLVRGSPGPHFFFSKNKNMRAWRPAHRKKGRGATRHNAGSPDEVAPTGATGSSAHLDKLHADMPFPVNAIQIDAFNTIRPNQALGGQTPAECLANLTVEETPASQTS